MSEMESPASRRQRGLLLLADAQPGINYSVSGIYERDRRLLEFLEVRGIRPAAKLRIIERNYDQTLTLSTTTGNVSLVAPLPSASGFPLPSSPFVLSEAKSLPELVEGTYATRPRHHES